MEQFESHPINEFVVKVSSRCNINCTYCYEYNLGDNSWVNNAKSMKRRTVEQLVFRIDEHARKHILDRINISFHGGEPLLFGIDNINFFVDLMNRKASHLYEIDYTIQTNGVLLTRDVIACLKRNSIYVGISIDGPQSVNDRFRVDHLGKSTFDKVSQGINNLKEFAPELFTGVLSVIDVNSDPFEVFDFISSLGARNIDFVLPHFNWSNLPPRHNTSAYHDWYMSIWRAWINGRNSHVKVRFLENIARVILGGSGIFEQMNDSPVSLVTVNSDGEYEGVDTLKSTASGAQKLSLNVFSNDIDSVVKHEMFALRQSGDRQLCTECLSCDVKDVCNGGYFPHRYSTTTRFKNPSVYCSDLKRLITDMKSDLYPENKTL
jgi:uncharacterized protein